MTFTVSNCLIPTIRNQILLLRLLLLHNAEYPAIAAKTIDVMCLPLWTGNQMVGSAEKSVSGSCYSHHRCSDTTVRENMEQP